MSTNGGPYIDMEHEFKHHGDSYQLEVLNTISRVPANTNGSETEGLRTEENGRNHAHYNSGSIGFIMTVLGCAFALAGSQIVPLLYLTLGTTIALELNAPSLQIWMFSAGLVASGAIAPFVGPIADLFGRKPVFLVGLVVYTFGAIICAATPTAGGFVVGQIFLGFGSVIQELLAIAVVAEIVPAAKRSFYAALILLAILPWSPGTLYANFMTTASWRWIGCALGAWNVLTLLILAIFYRPPPRVNTKGLTRREIVKRIDFVGGTMLTAGLVLFLVGINSGGQQYAWNSSRVISFLTLGLFLMVAFGLWEAFGASYPLFPRRIVHAPRALFCLLFVIFAAGINYMPLVIFWPIEAISVYDSDHFQLGINTLPIGTCIIGGAIISALLMGLFKGHVTILMTAFCVLQTIASACLSAIDPHDIRTAWAPLILALIGVGGVLVPNQIIITIITPDDLIASATALTVALRAQAQVIGLAIFYNRFVHEVKSKALSTIVIPLVESGVDNIPAITNFVTSLTAVPFSQLAHTVPGLVGSPNYEIVKEAGIKLFSESYRLVYYITIPFGVAACVAAASMGDISSYMDQHVAVLL